MNENIIKVYSPKDPLTQEQKEQVIDFLYTQMEEFRDEKDEIEKALNYALSSEPNKGGLILLAIESNQLVGVVVTNETGMSGYIPENQLVYLAVHNKYRRRGIGTKLSSKTIKLCQGSLAVHCESHNPAKILYEKLGFKTKYLEMRLKK